MIHRYCGTRGFVKILLLVAVLIGLGCLMLARQTGQHSQQLADKITRVLEENDADYLSFTAAPSSGKYEVVLTLEAQDREALVEIESLLERKLTRVERQHLTSTLSVAGGTSAY